MSLLLRNYNTNRSNWKGGEIILTQEHILIYSVRFYLIWNHTFFCTITIIVFYLFIYLFTFIFILCIYYLTFFKFYLCIFINWCQFAVTRFISHYCHFNFSIKPTTLREVWSWRLWGCVYLCGGGLVLN